MKNFAALLFATMMVLPASGQGLFISDGFGVQGGFSSTDGVATVGGSLGYVINGKFEIGGSASRTEEDGLALLELTPNVRFYPVRQSADMPITVYVGAGYSFLSFSGEEFDFLEDSGIDLSADGYSVGGGIAHAIEASPKLDIILEGSFYYNNLTLEASAFGETESESDSATSGALAVNFAFGMNGGNIFHLAPTLGFFDGDASFGVGLGIAIGN